MKRKMIDPPSGWKYGFPKEIPEHVDNTVQWLIDNGYPEAEIKRLGDSFYVRGWWEDKYEYETCSLEQAEEFAKKRNKMNAYELADAIEDWDSDGQWDKPAADMLRQQADLIKQASEFIQEQGLERQWIVWSTLKKASEK